MSQRPTQQRPQFFYAPTQHANDQRISQRVIDFENVMFDDDQRSSVASNRQRTSSSGSAEAPIINYHPPPHQSMVRPPLQHQALQYANHQPRPIRIVSAPGQQFPGQHMRPITPSMLPMPPGMRPLMRPGPANARMVNVRSQPNLSESQYYNQKSATSSNQVAASVDQQIRHSTSHLAQVSVHQTVPRILQPQIRHALPPQTTPAIYQRSSMVSRPVHDPTAQFIRAQPPQTRPFNQQKILYTQPHSFQPRVVQQNQRPAYQYKSHSKTITMTGLVRSDSTASLQSQQFDSEFLNSNPKPEYISRVATLFRQNIGLNTNERYSVQYDDSFTGNQAVNMLCDIIGTHNRELAEIYGECLQSENLFHNVNYTSGLQDTPREIYQLESDAVTPSGIFTPLTSCYSPTCGPDFDCYSPSCPMYFKQLPSKRCNAITDLNTSEEQEEKNLWSSSVDEDTLKNITNDELIRQEALFEFIRGEVKYVRELELIGELFETPLRKSDVIERDRHDDFIAKVLLNTRDILGVHKKLSAKLVKRQRENCVVEQVGDIMLEFAKSFVIYKHFCKGEPYAQFYLSQEKQSNPDFCAFLTEFQSNPKASRLGFDHYLVRPRGRIGHYVTLLERIHKKTSEHSKDKRTLPGIIQNLKEILNVCNEESGKSSNILKLQEYQQDLDTPANAAFLAELDLMDPAREILRSNVISLRRPTGDYEKYLILFDHVLVITSRKKISKRKIHKKLMPIQLVEVTAEKQSTESSVAHQSKYVMVLNYKGKEKLDFYAIFNTEADRKAWIQTIDKQKDKITLANGVYNLTQTLLSSAIDINSSARYENYLFVGTDDGLYCIDSNGEIKILFLMLKIMQLDIVDESDLLMVLAGKGKPPLLQILTDR